MKKQLLIIGITLVLMTVGLSGCTENGGNGGIENVGNGGNALNTEGKIAFHRLDYNNHLLKMYLINSDGTDEKYMGEGVYGYPLKWCSYGNKIFFARSNLIHMINPYENFDETVYYLPETDENVIDYGWLPNQNVIYVAYNGLILFVNGDGGDLLGYNITGNWINQDYRHYYIFSSDGTKIAFKDSDYSSIYSMNLDGTKKTLLAEYSGRIWLSPDLKKIAKLGLENVLYISDINGAKEKEIKDVAVACWSPDSSKIIYCTKSYDWYCINADGTNKIFIKTFDCGDRTVESWSPDSKMFTFSCYGTIYVVNANGSGSTSIASGEAYGPRWSPS